MKLSLLASLLTFVAGPGLPQEDFEIAPRTIAWSELASTRAFDLNWRLPAQKRAPGPDLLADMESLVALRFDLAASGGGRLRTLGDLVVSTRELGPKARERWISAVLERGPASLRARADELRQLLLDDRLFSERWDPDSDHARDGMLMAKSWDLKQEGQAPWSRIKVDTPAEQAAILMRADLADIKTAENDYRAYPDNVGAKYREIYPLDGTYVRGEDEAGNAFAALKLYFRSPLPLWYDDYRCELASLTHVDEHGRVVCHIYSKSKDFHWMAGRDVFLPVDTGGGERVGYLVVRQYGFDIDDVPDKAKHHRAALRGSLGNLRRRAEALAGERRSFATEARVPEFRLRGRRP